MFVNYRLQEELYLPAEQYTHNLPRAVREAVLRKYLFRITRFGLCVRLKSIQILDNVILRKEADLLLKLSIEIVVIKLTQGEYHEGTILEIDEQRGITISFMGGLLEGCVHPDDLHEGSAFNGVWVLPFGENSAFSWKVGEQVRFKVERAEWMKQGPRMRDLISLRCNEQGLGPISWWI